MKSIGTMAVKVEAMLNIDQDICRKIETRVNLDELQEDGNDLNSTTRKNETKKFIPKKMREINMPLTHTKIVKNNGRCTAPYGTIGTIYGRKHEAHKAWKQPMTE